MRIGELAKTMGLNPKTLRYYDDIGLLPPASRSESGYRQYGESEIARLEFIRSAQALGVTLGEIREILEFRDHGNYPCPYVRELISRKLVEIEARIRGLQMLAADLKGLRRVAGRIPSAGIAAKARFCHIIENSRLLQAGKQESIPNKSRKTT